MKRADTDNTESRQWNSQLEEVFYKMNRYIEESVSFEDEEDIHQARVNNRKLLTLIKALEPDHSDKVLAALKKTQKLLGSVRDCDVLIEAFKKRKKSTFLKEQKKVIKKFILFQKELRKKYRKKMKRKLPNLLEQKLEKRWNQMQQEPLAEKSGQIRLLENFKEQENRFDERRIDYENFKQNKGVTDPDTLEALHKVRLSVKELRYLLKYMDFVIEFDIQAKQQYYEDLQEQLGGINDYRVWIEKWEQVSSKELGVPAKQLRSFIEELKTELEKLLGHLQIPRPELV